jgi:hypothetical protein
MSNRYPSKGDGMDDHDHHGGRFAELQQRWHGWGAPVGAGIALLSLGGFLLLLAQACLVTQLLRRPLPAS